MPAALTVPDYLAGLHRAVLDLTRHADRAGLDTAVPTCPDWTVRRLVGHQGYVHRWATAALRGDASSIDEAATERVGRRAADPLDWLRDGVIELVGALADAPDDLEAMTFLHDAPAARLFWARRQCHETAVHAVDVQAAALGRLPRATETGIGSDLALDGIDELLLGFVPRSRSRLRSADPVTLLVSPTDAEHCYTVEVTPDPPRVTRLATTPGPTPGTLVIEAPSVALHLALWHRSDEIASEAWPLWAGTAVQ